MRLLLLLIGCLLALACQSDQPIGEASEAARPRILSLSPHATQMLEEFDVLDNVVGVTDFCPLPQSHASIPRVGGLMNPNVERMLSLRPTIVFHAPTVNGPQERLASAGIRVVALANESLADIHSGIEIMGRELGMKDRATGLLARSRAELEALQEELANVERPSVLFVIGHAPGSLRDIHSAGPDTFLDEMITIAGGSNHMAGAPTRYPVVSRESLIQEPPDLVIMAAPTGGWADGEQELLRAQWRTLLGNAGQAVRVEFLNQPELTIPGPRVHRSARRLALLMHPSIAED